MTQEERYNALYQEFNDLLAEWDGDIKDAVESWAVRGGVEGVESGSTRFFDDYEKKATGGTIEENSRFLKKSGFDEDMALKLAIGFQEYRKTDR